MGARKRANCFLAQSSSRGQYGLQQVIVGMEASCVGQLVVVAL